jgi:hypothetical protein
VGDKEELKSKLENITVWDKPIEYNLGNYSWANIADKTIAVYRQLEMV